jgi:hypothetical protein
MLKNILLISQSALRKSADRPERSNGARQGNRIKMQMPLSLTH